MAPQPQRAIDRNDLWKIESCQFEDLKFADQKAVAILGISDIIAAVVSYFSAIAKLSPDSTPSGRLLLVMMVLMILLGNGCAIVATLFAVWAIKPRGRIGSYGLFEPNGNPQNLSEISLIHLTKIAAFQTPDDYKRAVQMLSDEGLADELTKDIHRMAGVAREKYRWIYRAVWFAGAEVLIFLIGLTGIMILRILTQ